MLHSITLCTYMYSTVVYLYYIIIIHVYTHDYSYKYSIYKEQHLIQYSTDRHILNLQNYMSVS